MSNDVVETWKDGYNAGYVNCFSYVIGVIKGLIESDQLTQEQVLGFDGLIVVFEKERSKRNYGVD